MANRRPLVLSGGNLPSQFDGSVDTLELNGNMFSDSSISVGTEAEYTIDVAATTYTALYSAHAETSTDFDYLAHRHSDTATVGGEVVLARSRGTGASETIITTGDRLGEIAAVGHDGTDYAFGARIQFDSTGTIAANSIPTNILFKVAPDGGGAPATAMTINEDKIVDFAASITSVGITDTGVVDFGGATSVEIPNGAGGTTVNVAGEITIDTTSDTLNFYDGTEERVLTPYHSKSITIEDPTNAEDISVFFTKDAITVTEMRAVCVGTTPSVTWTIRHGTDRSAAGAEVVTSGTTTTSTTTGSDVTAFNDATIVADSFVWLETTAKSGTVDEIHITIYYDVDA